MYENSKLIKTSCIIAIISKRTCSNFYRFFLLLLQKRKCTCNTL